MNRIEADLKQLQIREVMKSLSYDMLELVHIESKRELDDKFLKNQMINGDIKACDARLFK